MGQCHKTQAVSDGVRGIQAWLNLYPVQLALIVKCMFRVKTQQHISKSTPIPMAQHNGGSIMLWAAYLQLDLGFSEGVGNHKQLQVPVNFGTEPSGICLKDEDSPSSMTMIQCTHPNQQKNDFIKKQNNKIDQCFGMTQPETRPESFNKSGDRGWKQEMSSQSERSGVNSAEDIPVLTTISHVLDDYLILNTFKYPIL